MSVYRKLTRFQSSDFESFESDALDSSAASALEVFAAFSEAPLVLSSRFTTFAFSWLDASSDVSAAGGSGAITTGGFVAGERGPLGDGTEGAGTAVPGTVGIDTTGTVIPGALTLGGVGPPVAADAAAGFPGVAGCAGVPGAAGVAGFACVAGVACVAGSAGVAGWPFLSGTMGARIRDEKLLLGMNPFVPSAKVTPLR